MDVTRKTVLLDYDREELNLNLKKNHRKPNRGDGIQKMKVFEHA